MITKKVPIYIGLARADFTEPTAESGYTRICLGTYSLQEITNCLENKQIVFNEVRSPGYGHIAHMLLYLESEGSEPFYIWNVQPAIDVHEGVTPAIFNGHLIRGIEVQAEIILNSNDLCDPRGI